MEMKPGSSVVVLALAALLAIAPVQAFAGNGNSHSQGGNGNANGNSGGSANSQGKTASSLGALNAAHASPQAFANAAPNSEIGKIKAYFLANQTAALSDAAALQEAYDSSAPSAVRDAYEALLADPANTTLQAAYDQAITDAGLTAEQVAALAAAYAAWQDAVAADAEAAATLEAAANKTPVSDETKAALDALLVGKIY